MTGTDFISRILMPSFCACAATSWLSGTPCTRFFVNARVRAGVTPAATISTSLAGSNPARRSMTRATKSDLAPSADTPIFFPFSSLTAPIDEPTPMPYWSKLTWEPITAIPAPLATGCSTASGLPNPISRSTPISDWTPADSVSRIGSSSMSTPFFLNNPASTPI